MLFPYVFIFSQLVLITLASISIYSGPYGTDIYLNGRKVDLNKAAIIKMTDDETHYRPIEDPSATIIVDKYGGIRYILEKSMSFSFGPTMTPLQKAEFEKRMRDFEEKMRIEGSSLSNKLNRMGHTIAEQINNLMSRMFGK